jgi:hypothetical protein
MNQLEQRLLEDINWRISELSIIKSIPYLFPFNTKQKEVLLRYSIPAMYALWEGFVSTAFTIYTSEINKLNLPIDSISIIIVANDIDIKYHLQNGRTIFDKKVKLIKELDRYRKSELKLSAQLPTESNITFKVINNILYRFNLPLLAEEIFKNRIDKLVMIRNIIAHGESHIVTQDVINELSEVVIELMNELFEILISSFEGKTFLK